MEYRHFEVMSIKDIKTILDSREREIEKLSNIVAEFEAERIALTNQTKRKEN